MAVVVLTTCHTERANCTGEEEDQRHPPGLQQLAGDGLLPTETCCSFVISYCIRRSIGHCGSRISWRSNITVMDLDQ
ncbi:hypothetical protein OJAV_G00155960 [Oryzias javanicus]|uniref:Uncharacterized protein n=1 Tax=Oryzias javanicus TaxID=123683 RepID=A0A437CI23_ORYJA|nr:hypothetical protein OJAV_G00155960 [Oryzias javanicus]